MPAEAGVGPGDPQSPLADGQRRQWWVGTFRKGGVATESRHRELPVYPLVVRRQLVIRQWPIACHTVDRVHPKVVRQQARPLSVVKHGAAADTVPVDDAHVRRGGVDRVVVGTVTHDRG